MSKNIHEAPHGMNLVVESSTGKVYVGRFDETNGFEVLMRDCDVFEPGSAESADAEHWVRETATYGVDVKHRTLTFPSAEVTRWRALGDIEKLDI